MCGGPLAVDRPDSTDLMAIIHPATSMKDDKQPCSPSSSPSSSRSSSPFRGRLRLFNRMDHETVSELDCDGSAAALAQGPLSVRIHRYASPPANQSDDDDQSCEDESVMHSFIIADLTCNPVSTRVKMDLGIGGDGIVGRPVTILDSQQRIVGAGIIGRM